MGFIPLIIDTAVKYARPEGTAASALSLPLGANSVLEHMLESLTDLHSRMAVVLEAPGTDLRTAAGTDRLAHLRLVGRGQLKELIENLDSSDWFVVMDLRSWPLAWPSADGLHAASHEYRGATHTIAIGSRMDRAIERIECNDEGQIRGVQRLYAATNWPQVAGHSIAYSLVPVRAMSGLHFNSLAGLRRELAIRGVLGRDKPVACDLLDLAHAECYLALNERVLVGRDHDPSALSSHENGTGIFVSQHATVASSARLIPPLVVREGATVGDNAMVVGPAVIGPSAHVQAEAVVAQSVVLDGVVVAKGSEIRQAVYAGGETSGTSRARAGWPDPQRSGTPFSASSPPRRPRRIHLAAKRMLDVLVSGSALMVLSPLVLLISVLVRLDSRGPILFGHLRERRGGKEFKCLKFRTMEPDADARQRELLEDNLVDGPQVKIRNDPRVTRVGHWLRATNLDELPQLINVFVGHMSLVGPRPSPFRENQICVPWRHARLSVRPGITGLWQICRAADRSRGDFHEWIFYDMTYVRHFSFWLDLKLLLATFLTLGGHWHVPLSWIIGGLDGYGRRPRGQPATA
jgi:lipopolysaccharide/colanic/teichoic acid biosynthesis glycosyltransferase